MISGDTVKLLYSETFTGDPGAPMTVLDVYPNGVVKCTWNDGKDIAAFDINRLQVLK